ncbi:hypothetical protein AB1N83_008935 [Pleurotus pulmonarius]|nr:hypothetical protein EYR38_005083 [Pleurotus pulmonarius]
MTLPNHLPSTTKSNTPSDSRESSYEAEGNTIPPHLDNFTAATPFHGISSEHDPAFREPAPPLPVGIGAQWNQVTGHGTIVESIYPPVTFDSTMNEDGYFPRQPYPSPTYPTWIAAAPGQVSMAMDAIVAQDSENAPLINESMTFNVEAPSSELGPPLIYPEVTGWNHSTVMAFAPMPSKGAMGPVGNNHPLFPSFSDPGQAPQPAQGVLNAMVVRPVIGTPATALEAERRRVHPRRFSCDFCPEEFTSKPNRERHHRAHLGIKPFVCACGKAFTAKGDLLRHRRRKYKSCQAHIPLSAAASSS